MVSAKQARSLTDNDLTDNLWLENIQKAILQNAVMGYNFAIVCLDKAVEKSVRNKLHDLGYKLQLVGCNDFEVTCRLIW